MSSVKENRNFRRSGIHGMARGEARPLRRCGTAKAIFLILWLRDIPGNDIIKLRTTDKKNIKIKILVEIYI